jgi:hypothetical protein
MLCVPCNDSQDPDFERSNANRNDMHIIGGLQAKPKFCRRQEITGECSMNINFECDGECAVWCWG